MAVSPPVALYGYTFYNLAFILPTPPGQVGSNEVIGLLIFMVGWWTVRREGVLAGTVKAAEPSGSTVSVAESKYYFLVHVDLFTTYSVDCPRIASNMVGRRSIFLVRLVSAAD